MHTETLCKLNGRYERETCHDRRHLFSFPSAGKSKLSYSRISTKLVWITRLQAIRFGIFGPTIMDFKNILNVSQQDMSIVFSVASAGVCVGAISSTFQLFSNLYSFSTNSSLFEYTIKLDTKANLSIDNFMFLANLNEWIA